LLWIFGVPVQVANLKIFLDTEQSEYLRKESWLLTIRRSL